MCYLEIRQHPPTKHLVDDAHSRNPDGTTLVRLSPRTRLQMGGAPTLPQSDMLYILHARLGSSGPRGAESYHPLHTEERYLWHNGTIPKLGTPKYSDTKILLMYLEEKQMDPDAVGDTLMELSGNGCGNYIYYDRYKGALVVVGKWVSNPTCTRSGSNHLLPESDGEAEPVKAATGEIEVIRKESAYDPYREYTTPLWGVGGLRTAY